MRPRQSQPVQALEHPGQPATFDEHRAQARNVVDHRHPQPPRRQRPIHIGLGGVSQQCIGLLTLQQPRKAPQQSQIGQRVGAMRVHGHIHKPCPECHQRGHMFIGWRSQHHGVAIGYQSLDQTRPKIQQIPGRIERNHHLHSQSHSQG